MAVSVVVMPFLSFAQRRAGRELGSASAVADSKQTLLCTYLSAAVLAGLVLNAALGWWWADPVAALLLAALAVKEGRDGVARRAVLRAVVRSSWDGRGVLGRLLYHERPPRPAPGDRSVRPAAARCSCRRGSWPRSGSW